MGFVEENIRDLKRFDEIVRILADYQLGIVLDYLDLKHRVPYTKRFGMSDDEPEPDRLRQALEDLGPTFIKFGQLMAQRPDIVPQRYINQLENLEDNVKEFENQKAMDIVREEVGDFEDVFDSIEEEPIGSASIAQVYRATLSSGEDVVVKVRRPGIKEKAETDLDIMKAVSGRAENLSKVLSNMRIHNLVQEFGEWFKDEMDFEKEARNAKTIKRNMSDVDNVKVPKVYEQHSTGKVLVMEYVDGVKCTEDEKLKQLDVDMAEITHTGIEMGLKQVIRDGMFHADPHPSNFFIDEEGRIILIDFGMVGKLTKKSRRRLGLLILHIENEDVESAVDVITDMSYVSEDADLEKFKQDVERITLELRNSRAKDNSLSKTILDMAVKASDRGVYLPMNLVLTGKALVTLEGILLTVNPEARLTKEYREQVEQVLKNQYSLKDISKSLSINLLQNKDLITNAPSKINKMLETQSQEKTEVQVETSDHHEDILTASLVLSGAFLIAQALPAYSLKIVGTLFILAAAVLFSKKI